MKFYNLRRRFRATCRSHFFTDLEWNNISLKYLSFKQYLSVIHQWALTAQFIPTISYLMYKICFPSDINECDQPSSCPANSDCKNTPGTFSCTCKTGFTRNGMLCTGILCGLIWNEIMLFQQVHKIGIFELRCNVDSIFIWTITINVELVLTNRVWCKTYSHLT